MIHDVPEHAKRALDLASPIATGAAGVTAAVTLNQVALVMTILAAACSVVWFLIRVHDRLKYGHRSSE